MKQLSRYSRSFYSEGLTDKKYQEIHALAVSVRDAKNKISGIVNQDLFKYLEMSKIDFQKTMLPYIKDEISSHFTKQLCDDVYTAYQNKFNNVKRRLKFQHISDYHFNFYKRSGKAKNGREYHSGDFKSITIKHDDTPLSMTLTYLVRYGYFGIVDYLLEKFIQETNQEKEKFYADVLDTIYKFGFTRLFALAMSKRDRIIERYKENRKDQEHFECVDCGYKANADTNASINILNSFLNGECGGSSSHLAVSHGIEKENV